MKTRDLYRHCRPGREEGRPAWRPAEANRSHARVGAFSRRGADDDPYATRSRPPKAPAPSRETARFQWQVRWGTRGHPGARGTDESRAIPRTTRVLHALPNVPKLDVAGSTPVARSRESADFSRPSEVQREKPGRRASLGAGDISGRARVALGECWASRAPCPRKTATEVATAARCLSAALACEDALPATASGKVQKEVLR